MADTDPEAERVESLDARFGKLEAEQERQGGLLQQIVDKLGGEADAAHAAAAEHTEDKLDRPTAMQEAMAAALRKVNAERDQEAESRAHAAEHNRLAAPAAPPEHKPREAAGWKAKLQKTMFGGDA